jgi:diguanylate cyclase (GGDEF)-like protein/PAS domain S-box-containing protein
LAPVIREIEAVRLALQEERECRQSAESALRESEARWCFAIEGSGDGLWDWDVASGFVFYSAHWKQMLGFDDADIAPHIEEWKRLVHPDDKEMVMGAVQRYFDGKSQELMIEYRIACKDGSWKWILSRGMAFKRDANGKVARLIGTNCDISMRKQADMQIEYLAFYDQLTALPNRRLLFDRLVQMLATSIRDMEYGALIFIDLDDFKTLNDTWGHSMGDAMLVQVARRLAVNLRANDTVARLGGDEFVVTIKGLGTERANAAAEAAAVCEKLLSTISEPCMLGENEYRGSASIGVTLFGPEQIAPDILMGQADSAMYLAKSDGRATYRFFDAQLLAAITLRAAFEADLRNSVKHNELHLVYQPQLGSDGCVIGAEALVRWTHPVRGVVGPCEFIPVAEKSTFIIELGHWVLLEACRTLHCWAGKSLGAGLTLAVNVSVKQFLQSNFISGVIDILKETGANPARLKLELTESIFAHDIGAIAEKMMQLKQQGISFSLDDFGTGYSSLSYIKRLPFDQLKIDQSFVRDILADANAAAIVRTVVALCQSLGLSVIAEGVETLGQKEFLEKESCFAFQGYLFSKPLPLTEFDQFLGRNMHRPMPGEPGQDCASPKA